MPCSRGWVMAPFTEVGTAFLGGDPEPWMASVPRLCLPALSRRAGGDARVRTRGCVGLTPRKAQSGPPAREQCAHGAAGEKAKGGGGGSLAVSPGGLSRVARGWGDASTKVLRWEKG